jgi:hypothetical protein
MIRDEAQFDRRGSAEDRGGGEPNQSDILRRIATVVGEIDALKLERHAAPVLDARARLAAAYFRKRQPARTEA